VSTAIKTLSKYKFYLNDHTHNFVREIKTNTHEQERNVEKS